MHLHMKCAHFASRFVIDQFFTAVTRTIMTICKLLVTLSCYLEKAKTASSQACVTLYSKASTSCFWGSHPVVMQVLLGPVDATKLVKYCQPKVVSMPCTAERQTGQFFSLCKCLSKHALQNLLCMHGSS